MRSKPLLLLCLAGMAGFVSCSDDDKNPVSNEYEEIAGSGTLVTVDRTVAEFHSVALYTIGTVNLTSGAAQSLSITVDDNVAQYISTSVVAGELRIGSPMGVVLTDFDLTVNVTMTDLESVAIYGIGSFLGTNRFEADSIKLVITNVGTIDLDLDAYYLRSDIGNVGELNLSGSVAYHRIWHGSAGLIRAFGLESDTTVANMNGSGNAEVFVTDSLHVAIVGSGSVYYKGTPAIHQVIFGTGQVIDAN